VVERRATIHWPKSRRDANSVALVPRLIALDLPAGDEFVANVVRAWQSGDVVLPIDQRLPTSARRALLAYLAADVVVSANDVTTLASEHSPALVPLVEGDALVIATSGTTGEPKGVVHTHGSLNAAARLVGQRLNLSGDDHWWLCIPPAHIGGFGVVARALHHRSRLSFAQAIDQPAIDAARTEGATRTSVVPTLLTRHSFVGWRTVLVGGAASDALPNNAIATYGMTETAGGVVYGGAPLDDVDVRIEHGEILVRTPTMARTYRHAPLSLSDGWLATGDLGEFDGQRLIVKGRRDDLIITGGVKVWPRIVEARLREHALVDDVCVVGAPDAQWGSIVVAYVSTSAATAPTLEQLRSHVKETLSPPHAPQRLVVVPKIPRTTLGKVRRSELPSV